MLRSSRSLAFTGIALAATPVQVDSAPYTITPKTYWTSIQVTCPAGDTPCTGVLSLETAYAIKPYSTRPKAKARVADVKGTRFGRNDEGGQGPGLGTGARPGDQDALRHAPDDRMGERHHGAGREADRGLQAGPPVGTLLSAAARSRGRGHGSACATREHAGELGTRRDAELAIDTREVELDGLRAQEQGRGDPLFALPPATWSAISRSCGVSSSPGPPPSAAAHPTPGARGSPARPRDRTGGGRRSRVPRVAPHAPAPADRLGAAARRKRGAFAPRDTGRRRPGAAPEPRRTGPRTMFHRRAAPGRSRRAGVPTGSRPSHLARPTRRARLPHRRCGSAERALRSGQARGQARPRARSPRSPRRRHRARRRVVESVAAESSAAERPARLIGAEDVAGARRVRG